MIILITVLVCAVSSVYGVTELLCEKTEILKWSYMPNPLQTCFLDKTTSITEPDTQVKSDVNATGITFYLNKNVHYLPVAMSKVFPFLQIIQATYCSVKKIGPENFEGLKYVVRVWLGTNHIKNIPSGTFRDLESLVDLDLRKHL
jgi:hypothetical protein